MYYKKTHIGNGYFTFGKRKNNPYFLLKEDNYTDYYITKGTRDFKFVNDFSDNYANYFLIKKDICDKNEYQKLFNLFKEFKLNLLYLVKPLPINILEKIEIKN